jgi:hypothetical protein
MKQLQPTKLWVLGIPKEINEHKEHDSGYLEINGSIATPLVYLKDKFKILGTATKDEISFDVEPYVDKTEFTSLFDGSQKINYKNYFYPNYPALHKYDSFDSLLKANELYFENLFGLKPINDDYPGSLYDFKDALDIWNEAEQKVIKGKLLILEEI